MERSGGARSQTFVVPHRLYRRFDPPVRFGFGYSRMMQGHGERKVVINRLVCPEGRVLETEGRFFSKSKFLGDVHPGQILPPEKDLTPLGNYQARGGF